VFAALGAGTGYVLSGLSPDYRSEARIQIVPQRIPGDIVPIAAQRPLEDRLVALTQTILSRTRMERLIMDFNLYAPERRAGVIMQDVVELARRNISITVDPQNAADSRATFVVSFTAKDPRVAQQVAEKLAGFMIDESLKDGSRLAENTSDFVEAAVEQSGRRLAGHDARIAVARAAGSRDLGLMEIEAEVLRNTYKSMLEKREQAEMRVNMERRQIGEQFVLLDQARVPERPFGPTRRAASMAGAIAGLVLALIVNLFLTMRRALAARATVPVSLRP
jgi:uncharacterized protein involved in exopolysaccharide biosynthesis